jgi:ketosteroid isomerase-like protein
MRTLMAMAVATAVATTVVATTTVAQTDDEILEEVIAFEQGINEPWFQNDISGWVASIGDETTYFDPTAGRKLVGEEVREHFRTVYEGNIPPFEAEYDDASVVVHDDIVVFTTHTDVVDPATGDRAVRWLLTKVFERTDDGLQTIHIHFGLPAPPPVE